MGSRTGSIRPPPAAQHREDSSRCWAAGGGIEPVLAGEKFNMIELWKRSELDEVLGPMVSEEFRGAGFDAVLGRIIWRLFCRSSRSGSKLAHEIVGLDQKVLSS